MKLALFLLSACAAVLVIASPHNVQLARRHPVVAARAAVAIADDTPPLQKRQSNKRCKNRSLSSTTDVKLYTPTPSSTTPRANNPAPAPTPTTTTMTTPVVRPTTNPTPTTTQTYNNNLPSFMSGVQTGQGTFYDAGLGACGTTNNGDREYVVAVSWALFDYYPGYNKVNSNTNPVCGKKIKATYQGKSVTVTVVDRCADGTCLVGNLDFSKIAFQQLAPFSVGRLFGVTWEWVS